MSDAKSCEQREVTRSDVSPENHKDKESIAEENALGRVSINTSVIAMLAANAALAVPGVARLESSFAGRLASWLGAESESSGVKVEREGDGVNIEARIRVVHGVRIPDVVWQVQNDVRRRVNDITGKTVRTVNVIVTGVESPSQISSTEET